ncbi:hypothetical protein ACI2Q1_000809 [Salmonella enterica subsp. enterica]|nr:hypothetical protein [Salmonella enterica]
MNGADNFIFETLKGMIERQEISSWHAIAFVIALTVTFPILLKIGKIFVFFKNIKDSKINRLEKMLSNTHLEQDDIDNIKRSIKSILRYRITGIRDVERQYIVNDLISRNYKLISSDFFRKFRGYLIVKNGRMIFKKDWGYYFEINFYRFFAFQYLIMALLMVSLSIHRGAAIGIHAHIILWLIAGLFIFMLQAFAALIPTRKECELLENVLKTQSGTGDIVVHSGIKRLFRRC